MASPVPQKYVTSRTNGLKIAIPSDVRGIIPRFNTEGDNKLTFKPNRDAPPIDAGTMKIEPTSTEDVSPDDLT